MVEESFKIFDKNIMSLSALFPINNKSTYFSLEHFFNFLDLLYFNNQKQLFECL